MYATPADLAQPAAPVCFQRFVTGVQSWLNGEGMSTVRVDQLHELRAELGEYEALTADTEPHSWWSDETIADGCLAAWWLTVRRSVGPRRKAPPPGVTEAVVTTIHELGHHHSTDEGLVEAVARDLTRRWVVHVGYSLVPAWWQLTGAYDREVATTRRVSTRLSGAARWQAPAAQRERLRELVG
jgi:hypothetical protein